MPTPHPNAGKWGYAGFADKSSYHGTYGSSLLYIDFDPGTQKWLSEVSHALGFSDAMQIWYNDAATILSASVRGMLGHNSTYTLQPEYAAVKRLNPYVQKVPGTDPDQPLILTGSLWASIRAIVFQDVGIDVTIVPTNINQTARFVQYKRGAGRKMYDIKDAEGNVVGITSRQRAGTPLKPRKPRGLAINTADVARYGAEWNERTGFIPRGVERVMPQLTERLTRLLDAQIEAELGGTPKFDTWATRFVPGSSVANRVADMFPGGVPDYIMDLSSTMNRTSSRE